MLTQDLAKNLRPFLRTDESRHPVDARADNPGVIGWIAITAAVAGGGYLAWRYFRKNGSASGGTAGPSMPTGGAEGAGAPYVGSGWSWTEQNVFPSETSFLGLLTQMGYSVSGTSVLSAKNMAAVKRFQSEWNLAIANMGQEPFTIMPTDIPAHLTVDGLIGPSTVKAMSAVQQSIWNWNFGGSFMQDAWLPALTGKDEPYGGATPAFVELLQDLGYITTLQWLAASAATKKEILKRFQRSYNCAISTTDIAPDRATILEDGLAGPQTTAALEFAKEIDLDEGWSALLDNAGCNY